MAAGSDTVFVLDTNVFVEAHRRYYAFDTFPGFWDFLESSYQKSRLVSIDRVRDEIKAGNDALTNWADGIAKGFFASTAEQAVVDTYAEIMAWVQNNPQFQKEAKAQFARGADGWLIAYAKVNGRTVVTQETSKPEIKNRVPIPNVCDEFDVPYVDTFVMLSQLGARFK